MAELNTYRVDLPDGRFINVRSENELTEEQIQQVQEMAPPVGETKGSLEAGLTGAATGVAPSAAFLRTLGTVGRATAGAGPMVSIPSSLLAGLAAATATSIGQRKAIEAISPETAQSIEEAAQQQPVATMIGSALTSGFRPGSSLAKSLAGKVAERAVPAALGGGIQLGTEYLEGGEEGLPEGAGGRILTAAGINALLNRETALAQRIIGPARPAPTPTELPRVRPPTPVTDNLGQVKAGESLPSATAKANQMATEGGAAEPSPTEQIKQQTAARENQTRLFKFQEELIQKQQAKTLQAQAKTRQAEEERQAARMKSLDESYTEAFDLIAELQQLTGRSRENIIKLIPDKEIDPMLAFLRAEVTSRKDSDIKRRIRELELQEQETNRAMEEATARVMTPEASRVLPDVAPEAAMVEDPADMYRPSRVPSARNVEVQIIEQTRRNRERLALEDKANRIQADLLQRGVDILPEQARELARLEPTEFNTTRQRIIDAVVPEVQGPPVRRPTRLTDLAALTPESVGIEPPAPAPVVAVEAPLSAVSKAVARRTPRVKKAEAAPAVIAAQAEQAKAVPEVVIPATPKAAPETPVPAVSRALEAPKAPAPTPEAQMREKTIDEIKKITSDTDKRIEDAFEQARTNPKFNEWLRLSKEASEANRNAKFLSEYPLDYPPSQRAASTRKATKLFKELGELERAAGIPSEASLSPKVRQSSKSETAPSKAATKPALTKEEVSKNDLIDRTIENLDLARANLEPTSKIISILKKSGLMEESEIKLVQGAGKSMGAEDAATEAMSLLEFKRPTASTTKAPAAKLSDEASAVKAIETGMVEPEVVKPAAPVAAEASSLVPEAAPTPKPATTTEEKTQKFNRIKEALYKAKGLKPKAPVKEDVATAAAEAIAVTPEAPPAPVEAPAAPKAERLQVTKGTVFDKPYSFYKKEEGIGVPWFAEVNGVEYPLKARSVGTAKDEAKRLAAEQLRPSGEELGFRAFMRMPSPGEPLIGAAIGYATGDTEEERKKNAILGFQLGSLVSLGGVALGRRSANLSKLATNAARSEKGEFDIRTVTRAELNAVPTVKDAQGRLIAPNGKPSNLSEFTWKAVRTDRFKKWFGDWQKDPANASKVVDANGEPLAVYHGTRNVFEGFDRANSSEETRSAATFYDIMSDFGDNFATSKEVASRFAEDVYKNSPTTGSPNVQKVFLNIKNLENVGSEVEFKGKILNRKANSRTVDDILVNEAAPEDALVAMPGEEVLTAQERINKYETDPEFRASINQEAIRIERNLDEPSNETISSLVADWKQENPTVDGILYLNEAEKETRGIADKRAFISFKPEQVKSVWNRGTWSPDDINTLNAANVWWSRKPKTISQKQIDDLPLTKAANERDGFIAQLMAYTKADSQSVYNKMVADNKINNTGLPSAQVAQDIAKGPVHHQKMLSDLASAFPMITKAPGGQAISNAIGTFAKGVEKYLGTTISNIAARSARAAGAINTLFYEKSKQQMALWEAGAQALNDFTKTKLLKEQSDDFWRLARNGDVDGAKDILRSTEGGETAVQNYDLVLQQRRLIREEAKANGVPMGDIGDALPSIVADVDGLLKYLGVEERGRYGKMLEAARKAKADKIIKAAEEASIEPPDRSSIALTSDEEILVMSNYLTGVRMATGKPGFLKGRSIETVDKEMDQFYAPGSVALKRYYDKWVDYKLNKQFFGKVRPDLTPNEPIGGNIAKILAEDYKAGGLDDEGLKRVQETVRNLFQFDYRATNSLADKVRKVQTFAMLSDISTAVIQFADLFTMAYAYGGPKGIINAFKPGNRTTLRDINLLENPNVDIEDITKGIPKGGKIGRVVSAAYEAPLKYLLGAADKINKEGLLNSARKYVADIVQDPNRSEFKKLEGYYSKLYPERWPAMLEDLRKPEFREGKLTDNTAFFLRNELAKFQPIDLAGRAEGYAAMGPWGKTLYTLRSYAIKQLDILRRDVYDNFKKANETGQIKYAAKAIGAMAYYTALVGAGQQVFRYGMDEALGRKIEDPSEYAIQGAMGIMLVPRYTIYRLGEEGLFVAGAEWAVPGSGILNDLQQDFKTTAKFVTGQSDVRGFQTVPNIDSYFRKLEATKFLPGIGRELYWWYGKGAEKTKKLELEALMGKERPGVLEGIMNIVNPPNLKTEAR